MDEPRPDTDAVRVCGRTATEAPAARSCRAPAVRL